jgi:drug/metabolite transporter (DMT)-like permease
VNLIPAFCVLLGWLVLGEQLTHMQYIAAALIVLGVYISQEKTRITENGRDIS